MKYIKVIDENTITYQDSVFDAQDNPGSLTLTRTFSLDSNRGYIITVRYNKDCVV